MGILFLLYVLLSLQSTSPPFLFGTMYQISPCRYRCPHSCGVGLGVTTNVWIDDPEETLHDVG